MKIESKQVIEISGFLAIVLSVLFLAYELRQSNQIARTNTRIEIANQYGSLNESIYTNPEVNALTEKLGDPNFQPTAIEFEQSRAISNRIMSILVSVEIAYINGQYSERDFQFSLEDTRAAVRYLPGLHTHFLTYIESHPTHSSVQIFAAIKDEIEKTKSAN